MKLRFDADLPYQREAIDAVLHLFTGQPAQAGTYNLPLNAPTELVTELGTGNQLVLAPDTLLANVQAVQQRHQLPASQQLGEPHFSVEMETGTGKTYVYLRTLFELHQRYGFAKFIIVVPSVAIREGVLTSLRLMREHFQALYDHVAYDAWVYDARQYARLRQFAQSSALQILVMNIDAFNKPATNVIYQSYDQLSGRAPIEFIQAARPIVVLDEPQNMESDAAQLAIASLAPLCTLRYSATHRTRHHLLYKLDPVRAYDLRLVKRIDVSSVLDEPDFNQPYVAVQSISATRTQVSARLTLDISGRRGPERKTLTVKGSGADLFELSGERAAYRGFVVDEINAADGYVRFENGVELTVGQSHGGRTDDVMRAQIQETVREHFDREVKIGQLLPGLAGPDARLKVLSLFFIDRVANYAALNGKIRYWFEEAYRTLAALPRYTKLTLPPAEDVHAGYFAAYKGTPKDTRGDSAADDEAYELIMRDKERLLSPEEPVRFIFSHSALREGWDNPNVFQICTLNETRSEIKKRQEIGRGLRLPVLANGERCHDETINRLTIIANEHYDDFARQLQTEIEEECGVSFAGRITNKKKTRTARLHPGWQLNADFLALWNRLKQRTRYAVAFDTEELIVRAARNLAQRPKLQPVKLEVQKSRLTLTDEGLETQLLTVRDAEPAPYAPQPVPDLLGYLQQHTELTRQTLAAILQRSGRLAEVPRNPQQFLEQAQQAIQTELRQLMVEGGIKYERLPEQDYEMRLFEEQEITAALEEMVDVQHSIYDAVAVDSNVEREFAQTMSGRDDIRLFLKLPGWFQIPTPLGNYNPDWAIVKDDDARVYMVRETKGSKEELKLRAGEWAKIQCGKAHFAALGIDYDVVEKPTEV